MQKPAKKTEDKAVKKSILVTGGGTGGHLMPAIAICEILGSNGYEPILITDKRCEKFLPNDLEFSVQILDLARPKLSNLPSFTYSLFTSIYKSFKIIRSNKVKLVVACGGYSCAPIILTSILSFTPFVLQEQNSVVGKANYLFSYFAKRLFISFIHTINLPHISHKKIIWAQVPLLSKHTKENKIRPVELGKKVTILVTGGSQGAAIFDDVVTGGIILLAQKHSNIKFRVIQQSKNHAIEIENKYEKAGVECEVSPFFHNLQEFYSKSDFFIGRSGASTVNEVIHYTIPAIFIPYPHAANNHQYFNAKNLVEFEASWLLDQKGINPEKIMDNLSLLIEEKTFREKSISQLSKIKYDSSKIILNEIKKLIDKNH
ncbi:MAG: UDP-N-acetylglucosamine--N-acetylmuramyl-(pentapeptide) pyrophosphoryl-undecaprenol N-acetylglucosamine transferase [Rickettsiaceae bacterium]|nr:UDP-N-acetylglucosamine--N-acetylmuramyl-(pentapeptide) pyrophosphoryl-undecaprenol N-acetylglucosamine transferase [Rickettsiaceae bacterium]